MPDPTNPVGLFRETFPPDFMRVLFRATFDTYDSTFNSANERYPGDNYKGFDSEFAHYICSYDRKVRMDKLLLDAANRSGIYAKIAFNDNHTCHLPAHGNLARGIRSDRTPRGCGK